MIPGGNFMAMSPCPRNPAVLPRNIPAPASVQSFGFLVFCVTAVQDSDASKRNPGLYHNPNPVIM